MANLEVIGERASVNGAQTPPGAQIGYSGEISELPQARSAEDPAEKFTPEYPLPQARSAEGPAEKLLSRTRPENPSARIQLTAKIFITLLGLEYVGKCPMFDCLADAAARDDVAEPMTGFAFEVASAHPHCIVGRI